MQGSKLQEVFNASVYLHKRNYQVCRIRCFALLTDACYRMSTSFLVTVYESVRSPEDGRACKR
jgi:hypothetical protein